MLSTWLNFGGILSTIGVMSFKGLKHTRVTKLLFRHCLRYHQHVSHAMDHELCMVCKEYLLMHFYTPVWKTDVLYRYHIRPSVRLSVRVCFSACFHLSIWNLGHILSRWHDTPTLNFITIGTLWPSLQPKVGQTYFLQSWLYKSFKFGTKVARGILLNISSVSSKNRVFGILDFLKFSGLFLYMFWYINFKLGIYIQ